MFPVAEKFISINGESLRAGEPAVFIRFRGCNLNCSYCDTRWANAPDAPAEPMTAAQLAEYADSTGITNVTLTGGEPLLQDDIGELIRLLHRGGHRTEIETNGSISIAELADKPYRPAFTLDYKLPGSGMESAMLTGNYEHLRYGDAVKFVAGSIADLEKASEVIGEYGLTGKCTVFISTVFGKLTPADTAEFLIAHRMNDVRLQLQIHKYIWDPERRGV